MARSKFKRRVIALVLFILSFSNVAAYSEGEDLVQDGQSQGETAADNTEFMPEQNASEEVSENIQDSNVINDVKEESGESQKVIEEVEQSGEAASGSTIENPEENLEKDQEENAEENHDDLKKGESEEEKCDDENWGDYIQSDEEEDSEIDEVEEISDLSAISELGDGAIDIDGYFDDWDDKPYSWEYNWNNNYYQENYWDAEQGKNITKYWLDENGNPYNLEIRHKMSLYCDGAYVYLHIIISDQYGTRFNGEDYQFHVDGKVAAFQVEFKGGGTITGNTWKLSKGINEVEVRHRDSSMSYSVVDGAKAYLYKTSNDINDELELKIPLKALKQQNQSINIESFNKIEFFTPNLMYRNLTCAGTSTGPYAGIILGIGIVGIGMWKNRYKLKEGNR